MCKKTKKNAIIFNLIRFSFIFFLFLNRSVAGNLDIIGSWQTIDDVSGKPRSVISITKKGNQLRGNIRSVNFQKGESSRDRCELCRGSLHKRPIIGLPVLWIQDVQNGLMDHCEILDPKNGKQYHCQLTVMKGGKQLKVRGYIGLPWIGRTQYWNRIS